jgi:uncharacterized protein YPO0396
LAYLRGAVGSVVKVRDVETLRMVSRGVTKEGHAASGFGMFAAFTKDEDLVFGAEARRRRQQALEHDLHEVRTQRKELHNDMGNQRALAAKLRRLSLPGNADDADFVWTLCQERFDALEALARIDLTEAKELNVELERVLGLKTEAERQSKEWETAKLRHEFATEMAEKRIKAIDDALPGLKADVANANALFPLLEDASGHRLLAQPLTEQAISLAKDKNVPDSSFPAKAATLAQDVGQRLAAFLQALGEYNLKAHDVERITYTRERLRFADFEDGVQSTCAVLEALDKQLRQQENVGIAQNKERLDQAKRTFNHVFTSDFCFRIRSKVNNGVETLRELNRELEHLVFGGDRFKIEWSWVPQYQDYYRFFDAVHQRAEEFGQRNIFDADVLVPELAKVRDELNDLLLSSDRDVAHKRLRELADYRNYRRYEIFRESAAGGRIALSTWGTGSGGQLETPFYVVRSAVLSSAFRFFSKEKCHLRLMLSDEAFAKMDETRRRSVIRYLHEKLGVQLIVAMPTANAAAIKPEFEKEFTFARVTAKLADGNDWFAFEAQEKTLKRPALAARWDVAEIEARTQARFEFEKRFPGAIAANATANGEAPLEAIAADSRDAGSECGVIANAQEPSAPTQLVLEPVLPSPDSATDG